MTLLTQLMHTESNKPTAKLRVLLLCGDGDSSRIMFHGIVDTVDIVAVVVEDGIPTHQLLTRRVRKLGALIVVGQVAFMAWTKLTARLDRKQIAQLHARFGTSVAAFPEELVQRVKSVNSPEVVTIIEQVAPDAIVVNGTRIIGKRVLDCTTARFLNTHAGITPRYRGVHGGYWALASGDTEHCGVTVHLVDTGIDTGDVLYQATISVYPADNFNTYPLHQIAAALPLMRRALSDISNRCIQPIKGDPPSRLWSHPTLWQYICNRIFRGVK